MSYSAYFFENILATSYGYLTLSAEIKPNMGGLVQKSLNGLQLGVCPVSRLSRYKASRTRSFPFISKF